MPSLRRKSKKDAPGYGPGSVPRKKNAIVAAVSRLRPQRSLFRQKVSLEGWQREAWRQYELNGALVYAADWLAQSLSRVKLVVVELDEIGNVVGETENKEVLALVAGLLQNPAKTSRMLYDIGIQLFVPGDMHLIGQVGPDGTFSEWTVASTEEIAIGVNTATYDNGDGNAVELDLDQDLVFRLHDPNPRKHFLSKSSTKAALVSLQELEELAKLLFSAISNRLSLNGVLGVPSEMDTPVGIEDVQPGETPFMAMFTEAVRENIENFDTPEALVPIIVQAPADVLGAMTWLVNPHSDLPAGISELRDKALQRLAVDLNVPVEVVLGSSAANRFNVWQIEESSIKLTIEPKMILIVDALTDGLLRPAVAAADIEGNFAFWFDASELALRPDRSTDAKDLYDRGELSGDALRRETGFPLSDALTGDALELKQIEKLLAIAPQAVDRLLPRLAELLGIPGDFTPVPNNPDGTPPQPGAPDPNANPRKNPDRPSTKADPPVTNPSTPGTKAA